MPVMCPRRLLYVAGARALWLEAAKPGGGGVRSKFAGGPLRFSSFPARPGHIDHSSADWCGSKRGVLILINFYFLGWTAREWFRASCVGRGLDVWNVRAVLVVLDGVRSRAAVAVVVFWG